MLKGTAELFFFFYFRGSRHHLICIDFASVSFFPSNPKPLFKNGVAICCSRLKLFSWWHVFRQTLVFRDAEVDVNHPLKLFAILFIYFSLKFKTRVSSCVTQTYINLQSVKLGTGSRGMRSDFRGCLFAFVCAICFHHLKVTFVLFVGVFRELSKLRGSFSCRHFFFLFNAFINRTFFFFVWRKNDIWHAKLQKYYFFLKFSIVFLSVQ